MHRRPSLLSLFRPSPGRQGGSFPPCDAHLNNILSGKLPSRNPIVASASSLRCFARGFESDSKSKAAAAAAEAAAGTGTASVADATASDTLAVGACVAAFRGRGHLLARLDPLKRGADGFSGRGVWLGEDQGQRQRRTPLASSPSRSRSWADERLSRLLSAVDAADVEEGGDDSRLSEVASEALGLGATAASATFDLGEPIPDDDDEGEDESKGKPSTSPLVGGPPLGKRLWRLAPLVRALSSAYCDTLALEVDHLPPDRASWLIRERERLVSPSSTSSPSAERGQRRETTHRLRSRSQRRETLRCLARVAAFESFLASRFPKSKRFGLEGLDALAPGMLAAADELSRMGVQRLAVGTPHRGRLSLLAAVFGTPAGQIFAEMEAAQSEWHVGDVKYHLGKGATLEFGGRREGRGEDPRRRRRSLHVSVAPNPSHLEAVGPVVLGMVRAQQSSLPGGDRAVAPLLVHGDASFAGLGVVLETLQMSKVPGYDVGGTVHFVANNQCGFTTPPGSARTSAHPTAAAVATGAAVIHACADDPDAVIAAATLAARWRSRFRADAAVDVVGYRRHGHNELDDPTSSQPLTTRAILSQRPVLWKYSEQLERDGDASPGEAERWLRDAGLELEREHAAFERGDYAQSADDWLRGSWQGDALAALASAPTRGDPPPAVDERTGQLRQRSEPTGLPLETLRWVGRAITTPPPGFSPTPQAAEILASRRSAFEETAESGGEGRGGEGRVRDEDALHRRRVDFATAEALAFGSLALKKATPSSSSSPAVGRHRASRLSSGILDSSPSSAASGLNVGSYAVRLSGQDVERGTFNQRHAVLRDAVTGRRCVLLDEMMATSPSQDRGRRQQQERVEVWNSPLNEAAALAFEYGFSLGAAGRALVLWEAQFGDFANNAQAVVDLFVAAAEERWGQQSGIVLLLPHGFDGQGPDHSSARIERFLQLCNDDGDALPGESSRERAEVAAAYAALSSSSSPSSSPSSSGGRRSNGGGGGIDRKRASQLLESLGMPGDEGAELLFAAVGKGGGRGGMGGRGAGGAAAASKEGAAANDTVVAAASSDAAEALESLPKDSEHHLLDEASWSAAMRRYLRRHAEARANLFVVCPSTPAQLFHVLRRQLNRPFAKPLVVAAPKRLHVHVPATSALSDLSAGSRWHRVIADGDERADNTRHRSSHPSTGDPFLLPNDRVRRVLLCTGQLYYSLSAARRARKVRDVALVRLEQLSPFPYDDVAAAVGRYPNADVVWAQEEPKNQGAWRFVQSRANTALRELVTPPPGTEQSPPRTLRFIGRPPAGTTATASLAIHREELLAIVDAALATELRPTGAEGLERRS